MAKNLFNPKMPGKFMLTAIGILLALFATIYFLQRPNAIEGLENSSSSESTDQYGVPSSQIPQGDEDLYILKSQIVPPVCPRCPNATAMSSTAPPPPCPACERCPEPSFDCKKVPTYTAGAGNLPMPILNDFSTFGS